MPMSAKQENENRKSSLFTSPTCLLSTNQVTGKMEIQQPVLDDILNIEQQLNVVSITGLYRTGKSYLLTRLADRYTGTCTYKALKCILLQVVQRFADLI